MGTISKAMENRASPAAGSDDATLRAQWRREKIAARMALAPAEHARLSARIEDHLLRAFADRAGGVLAFCWPIRAEFDARPLVGRLIAAGWRAAIPTVTRPEAPMAFRAWAPDSPMTSDPFGIPVPAAAEDVVPDVVLLPLVAFAESGVRLGYGGGYFDRTLAALAPRPLAWGVGFELGLAPELRAQPHDVPLDAVITEAGIRSFPRATAPD